MSSLTGTRRGIVRAYGFGVLICLAGFLFGYDTGIVGGVLQLDSFRESFGYSKSNNSVKSLIVGLQQAGAFAISILIVPITERFGRKWSVIGACAVFCVGVVLQVVPSGSLPVFYVGRIIAGFGLGSAYCVVPLYSVEMAPKEIRGQMGSCFQWMYTWGILLSYWLDYAVLKTMPSIDRQWQIPIGFQMVPAAALALGLLTQPESVRWLMKQGRETEAWKSLSWMRASDDEATRAEFEEIRMGIVEELRASEGFRKKELLEPANRKRLMIAMCMFLNTQLTGSSALAYYSPQFFASLVGEGDNNLLISGLFGVAKLLACSAFILFFADRFDRKKIFIGGALGMSACMLIVAVLNKTFPVKGEAEVTSPGIAMVSMIFLDIIIYNFSWGPLPHPYVAEIFPTRLRAIGCAVGSSTQWLANFIFSLVTPYMISSMGWGTFLFYAGTDIWIAVYVFFFIEETRGKSIEEMETIFHSSAAFDVERVRAEARIGKVLEEEPADVQHVEGRDH